MPNRKRVELIDDASSKVHRPRLFADANFPDPIIQGLDRMGIKVKFAKRELWPGAPDEVVRQYARHKKMIVLTRDKGFWDDRAHPPADTAGIIIFDVADNHLGETFGFFYNFVCLFSKVDWVGAKAQFHQSSWKFKRREWPREKTFELEDGKVYEVFEA